MSLWRICPIESNKSVFEVQTWKKFHHRLVRKEVFDWAEFTVNSDTKPEIDLENANGYRVNHDPDYSWSLTQLTQTLPDPTINWTYPDTLSESEIDSLKNVIDRDGYLGLDASGWELVHTDFWIEGQLTIDQIFEPQEE